MAAKIAGLLKWCKVQCEGYRNVAVTNFTSSWKSGLAFCAIIHRYRPDLINFDSLPPNDTYGNSKLAFDVALSLGIPALLDPEDMVQMTVPDKLCIITYVSQYYNYFHNKPKDGGPSTKVPIKRPSSNLPSEPPPLDKRLTPTRQDLQANKRGTLDDKCLHCKKKVYLLERHISDGKLYHRQCFRESNRISSLQRSKGTEQLLAASRRLESSTRSKPLVLTDPKPHKDMPNKANTTNFEIKLKDQKAKVNDKVMKESPFTAKQPMLNNDMHAKQQLSKEKNDPKNEVPKNALEDNKSLNQKQTSTNPTASSSSNDIPPCETSSMLSNGSRTSVPKSSKFSTKFSFNINSSTSNQTSPQHQIKSVSSFSPDAQKLHQQPPPSQLTGISRNENIHVTPSDTKASETKPKWPDRQTFLQHKATITPPFSPDTPKFQPQMSSTNVTPRDSKMSGAEPKVSTTDVKKIISIPVQIKQNEINLSAGDNRQKAMPVSTTSDLNEARKSFFKQNNKEVKSEELEKSLNQPDLLNWKDSVKIGVFQEGVSSHKIAEAVGAYEKDIIHRKLFLPKFWKYSNVAKRRVSAEVPMSEAEISSSLVELDSKLKKVEEEGRSLEEAIRSRSEDNMEEDKDEMKKWLHLVKERSELIREESDLIYRRQQQILEKHHEELEYQLRFLSNIPDDLKTTEIKTLEEQILEELMKIVTSRNNIVDSIENDRIRYEEEDRQFEMSLAGQKTKKKKNRSLLKKKDKKNS